MNNIVKDNNMPLISIIIAVYNNEKYITNAIRSVQEQNFDDYEIVIVDDGSTDNTACIVDDEAKKDSRIKVIHQKNQWIYASFNNGIREASGKYIYILNSDDELEKDAFKNLSEAVDKYNYPDVVFTKVRCFECDAEKNVSNSFDVNALVNRDGYVDFDTNPEALVFLLESDLMLNQANLYKREIFENHFFRNDVYGADYLFNIDIIPDINTCAYISKDVYKFYIYSNSKGNASRKYYDYEHQMFNDFYSLTKELLESKKVLTQESLDLIRQKRRLNVRYEMGNIFRYDKSRTLEEKKSLIISNWDDVMSECYSLKGKEGYIEVMNQELNGYMSSL